MKNNQGQISVEYILIMTVIITFLITTTIIITDQQEKNTILSAAKIGAQEAVDKNAYSMYYNDTFNNYQTQYPRLLKPSDIDVINITLIEENNSTIKIQATAHSHSMLSNNEKYIVGSRINYYIRKSITETFKQEASDEFYNPALSNKYKIETYDVKWN